MRVKRWSLVRSVAGLAAVASVVAALACGSSAATGVETDDGGVGTVGVVGSGGLGGADAGGPLDGSTGRFGADGGPSTNSGAGSGDAGGVGIGPDGSGGTNGDGGSEGGVGVKFDDPSGALSSLDWIIRGPASYSGTVLIGDASSIEFVVGGVASGNGYTITLSGIDRDGLLCSGVSGPFDVRSGAVVGASVSVVCPLPPDGATVSVVTIGIGEAEAAPQSEIRPSPRRGTGRS